MAGGGTVREFGFICDRNKALAGSSNFLNVYAESGKINTGAVQKRICKAY